MFTFLMVLACIVPRAQAQQRRSEPLAYKLYHARNPKNTAVPLVVEPYQQEFRMSDSKVTFLAGGWGAGKSTAGLGWIEWAMHQAPGCDGIIIEPDHKKVRDFVNNKFRPAFAPYITGESRQDTEIYLDGGRRVIYLSGHQLEMLEQYEAAWLFADEVGLMKSELLPRALARVRDPRVKTRRIGFAGTPHWGWLAKDFDGRNDQNRRIIHVSSHDNPHLTPDYLDGLYDGCPASMAEAYIQGRFVPPGGSVYPEFDEGRHAIPWTHTPALQTGVAIDWSARSPHVLFVQILPEGYMMPSGRPLLRKGMVIFDELYPDGTKTPVRTDALCDLILAKNIKLDFAVADPAGLGTEASSGIDQMQIARGRLGLQIRYTRSQVKRNVRNGVEHVTRMLAPIQGDPSLYVAESLTAAKDPRAVVRAFHAYSYPKDRDGKPMNEEPVKDGVVDHAMDCVRYLAVNLFPVARLTPGVRSIA
jgi:hypothetical protein